MKAEGYASINSVYYEITSESSTSTTVSSFSSICKSATGKLIEINDNKKICIDSVNSVDFPTSDKSNYIIKEGNTYKLTKLIPNIIAKIQLEGK